MLSEADLDAVVIAAPTTSHLPLTLTAIERGIAVLVEKPLASTTAEADLVVAAASAPGRPAGPGRPHRAVQPGDPRARPAPRGGLALVGLRHLEPSLGSVPGPHPGRRGDPRPCHARRGHPLLDRVGAPVARLGRDRPAHPRRPRGPAVRPDVVPVGHGRDARRRLAHPGQATPADGPRRGGDVRARLPHPAADLRPRHRHVGAAADRRLRADLRERRRRAAGRHRRTARRRARGVHARRPERRTTGRRRGRRALGRRPGRGACSPRPGNAGPWSWCPVESDRQGHSASVAAGWLDRAAGQRMPSPAGPPRSGRWTGETRHGRHGRGRRGGQDGPPLGGPVRLARLERHRRRHRPVGGRRRSTRVARTSARNRASPTSSPRPIGRAGCGPPSMARRRPPKPTWSC